MRQAATEAEGRTEPAATPAAAAAAAAVVVVVKPDVGVAAEPTSGGWGCELSWGVAAEARWVDVGSRGVGKQVPLPPLLLLLLLPPIVRCGCSSGSAVKAGTRDENSCTTSSSASFVWRNWRIRSPGGLRFHPANSVMVPWFSRKKTSRCRSSTRSNSRFHVFVVYCRTRSTVGSWGEGASALVSAAVGSTSSARGSAAEGVPAEREAVPRLPEAATVVAAWSAIFSCTHTHSYSRSDAAPLAPLLSGAAAAAAGERGARAAAPAAAGEVCASESSSLCLSLASRQARAREESE